MNADTLRHLEEFEAVADTLRRLWPEIVSADDRDRRTAVHADASPWDAIDDALDLLFAIEGETPDHPGAFEHWRREGWRAVVLAADAAVGGDMEPADLDGMTTAEIEDELTYLSDYQG